MKVTTLKETEYKGDRIYVMHFDLTFQYLISHKKKIYQDRIELRPVWWKILLFRLGILKEPYTKQQIDEVVELLLSGAVKTIDALKKANNK